MNLVIDIGNTHTKVAWYENGKLIENFRYKNTEPLNYSGLAQKHAAEMAILSAVGQTKITLIKKALKGCRKTIILNHQTSIPLLIKYKTPKTLGYDRIAAAAGARCIFPGRNVLVIDTGTAITIDFITSNGEYAGGNISPGLITRFKALNTFTAKLPLVEKDNDFPAFGSDTRTAIVAGVQEGIIFELNGYIDKFVNQYPDCEFIITGGDAGFFVPKLKRPIFAEPDLVLTGLNFILDYNSRI
jgi:type III pantothenate kinase